MYKLFVALSVLLFLGCTRNAEFDNYEQEIRTEMNEQVIAWNAFDFESYMKPSS